MVQSDSTENKLLAQLAPEQFALIAPFTTTVSFPQNAILLESGDDVDQVYFPLSGMVSLLVVMRNGKAIETSTVGREGVIGAMAGFGFYKSSVRVVVQLPMTAIRIPSIQFRKAIANSTVLRDIGVRYNEALLTQARITAACNALHPVEERFARWLLQSADHAGSNTIGLTQELMAEMLGVRRTSVTEVAGKLQAAGYITYSRGVIRIVERAGLERAACECYETLHEHAAEI